jgi:predicted regulator of Ras-like GTPase activity (Roadblock/LC7/MglB family)
MNARRGMIDTNEFSRLLDENPSFEAVVRMSRDGLPLFSRARTAGTVDQVVAVAAGLFASALESGLMRDGAAPRLFVSAGHGALYLRTDDDRTLLLILTNSQCTEQQLETIIDGDKKRI